MYKSEGEDMDRVSKRLTSWALLASSFILLILYFPIVWMTDIGSSPLTLAAFTILVMLLFASMVAVIGYSEEGWRIEGTTLEWIVAAMIAPFLTLALYFISKGQDKEDTIDPLDLERIERL